MTLIQIDNYGPWTVTPRPRTESDLQMLQANLFADLNQQFGNKKGLVFLQDSTIYLLFQMVLMRKIT